MAGGLIIDAPSPGAEADELLDGATLEGTRVAEEVSTDFNVADWNDAFYSGSPAEESVFDGATMPTVNSSPSPTMEPPLQMETSPSSPDPAPTAASSLESGIGGSDLPGEFTPIDTAPFEATAGQLITAIGSVGIFSLFVQKAAELVGWAKKSDTPFFSR